MESQGTENQGRHIEEQLFLGPKRIVRTRLSSKGEKNEQRNHQDPWSALKGSVARGDCQVFRNLDGPHEWIGAIRNSLDDTVAGNIDADVQEANYCENLIEI
jgi:hypothetical protein